MRTTATRTQTGGRVVGQDEEDEDSGDEDDRDEGAGETGGCAADGQQAGDAHVLTTTLAHLGLNPRSRDSVLTLN